VALRDCVWLRVEEPVDVGDWEGDCSCDAVEVPVIDRV
jgi:hypothetical protein